MTDTTPIPDRASGILLHVTSLPSPYGIGDLGPAAYEWIDLLARTHQRWWQVLPVGPIGPGDSPYSSFSAMGANTLLISPDLLIADGLLGPSELPVVALPQERVDYDAVRRLKGEVLERAWRNFSRGATPALRAALEEFVETQADWLREFSLYAALKERFGGVAWYDWPKPLALREAGPLRAARQEMAERTAYQDFCQFLIHRQWDAMRRYAAERGVGVIGDLPLFVTVDSVDVWANPEQFLLDADRQPTLVAGAPPDYFSPTGQLWGNALYDWKRMREDGYRWWVRRMQHALRFADLVRLDHFRGLEAAWHIPAGSKTAATGTWQPGPGAHFLDQLQAVFGRLPVIAEDLGFITPAVRALRDQFDLPGMAVLQFAFDSDAKNPYLPHHHVRNMVVYTGTHDNDTTVGWFWSLSEAHRERVRSYTCQDGHDIAWDLIRMAWASVANLAIVPLQDVLMLDAAHRMNRPGVAEGNWRWRVTAAHPVAAQLQGLDGLTERYDRLPPADAGPANTLATEETGNEHH
jgi:4-alpha-glucanotransferase